MSQYTSTKTLNNSAVNAILDTETNQVTFTVTLPAGNIITVTGNNDSTVFSQLEAAGISSTSTAYLLAARAIRDVRAQAAANVAVATATSDPPPAESQAIPTNNLVDPGVPPTDTLATATNLSTTVDDGSDPYVSNGQSTITPVDQQVIDDGSDPYVSNGQPTITPEPQPVVDDGSDPYVSNGQSTIAAETPVVTAPEGSSKGLSAPKTNGQSQATAQDQANFTKQEDWRVRLSLAPGSNYLYNAKPAGILEPLAATGGVIFPYTPNIQVNYAASYDATDLTHSNYKVYQYKNSSVDNVTISCDFTAQDTFEANYLLAVIHFFRSVTKMFYGQDNGPKPGTPPPLCFLTGLGAFQFNEHPLAITSFNYSLPTDVDYIRASQAPANAGVNLQKENPQSGAAPRLLNINKGGNPTDTVWGSSTNTNSTVTYVPTKMQIQISAVPVVSRNDVSNNFSLTDYSSGKLLRGIQNVRGGFW